MLLYTKMLYKTVIVCTDSGLLSVLKLLKVELRKVRCYLYLYIQCLEEDFFSVHIRIVGDWTGFY